MICKQGNKTDYHSTIQKHKRRLFNPNCTLMTFGEEIISIGFKDQVNTRGIALTRIKLSEVHVKASHASSSQTFLTRSVWYRYVLSFNTQSKPRLKYIMHENYMIQLVTFDNHYSYKDPELPLCVSVCAKNLPYESYRMIQDIEILDSRVHYICNLFL